MPSGSAERRAAVFAADLFFRAKLEGIVRAAGWTPVRSAPAEVYVVELGGPGAPALVAQLAGAGGTVLAFGSHVRADDLRRARELGAIAVPNSQVEGALAGILEARPPTAPDPV